MTRSHGANPVLAFLFFAALFCATFEKVHWQAGLTIRIADVLAFLFVMGFTADRLDSRDRWLPRTAAVLCVFLAAFLLVYLLGFYNLDTSQSTGQWAKGFATFLIHFLFLAFGVAFVARESEEFFWRALGWFCAGVGVNAAYGLLQLAAAQAGFDIDKAFLAPITGGAASINIYGAVNGANVYRPNALTGDPNHLGIVLILPLLILTPIYLRLEEHHPWRKRLAWVLAFMLIMELATLSRSGLLGLVAGNAGTRAIPYRGLVFTKRLGYPLAGVAAAIVAVAAVRLHFVETVLRSRTHTSSKGASVHFGIYDFIPKVLHLHPLFGLGFNTFSVYYEFITGKTDWGPHSFYVALIVETGLVGTALFAGFLIYLFARLARRARSGARWPGAATLPPRRCGRWRGGSRRRSWGRWPRTRST